MDERSRIAFQKHGHVTPRPDGFKAKCGGPAMCSACAYELAAVDANLFGDGYLRISRDGRARRVEPLKVAALSPTPADVEFLAALERCAVTGPLEVYTSNSYQRVGLAGDYKVLLSAYRHVDGQLDITNPALLAAMVVAFNAMLARALRRPRVVDGLEVLLQPEDPTPVRVYPDGTVGPYTVGDPHDDEGWDANGAPTRERA